MSDRQAQIDGLREMADYLEARPDVPMPYVGLFNGFAGRDELTSVAKAMGGFDKEHDGNYLSLVKTFGPVRMSINFASSEVCEKVVVGTEEVPEKVIPAHTKDIVEWRCPESILAYDGKVS